MVVVQIAIDKTSIIPLANVVYHYLGAAMARVLSQQLDPKTHSITLLEQREYYLHYPGSLRMLVSSENHLE